MIKKELVKRVASETNKSPKETKEIIEKTMDIIKEAVANGEKVSLVGFGVFEKRERAEKKGTNPSNGKPMIIPATQIPYFRPGTAFKEDVKK